MRNIESSRTAGINYDSDSDGGETTNICTAEVSLEGGPSKGNEWCAEFLFFSLEGPSLLVLAPAAECGLDFQILVPHTQPSAISGPTMTLYSR